MNDSKTELALPHGWRLATLGEIARVFSGSSAPQGKDFFSESGAPFVRVSDLSNCNAGGILLKTRDRLSETAISNCSLVKAPKGAVVFPKSGAAIATNRRAVLGMDAYIVGHLISLVAKQDVVLTEWLYSAMRQIDMMEHSDNTGYPSLKKSAVEKIRISLPPLAEQKRIVAVLNEQMAAVEKARAAALERVEAVWALPSAFLREIFSLGDGELPHGWRWAVLGDVCTVQKGATPRIGEYVHSGLRLIKFRDIGGKTINWAPGFRSFVNPDCARKLRQLKVGMTLIGADAHNPAYIGKKVTFVDDIPEESAYFSGEIIAVAPKANCSVISEWPFFWLSSHDGYKAMQEKVVGVHLNKTPAEGIEILLPPLAEQKRIVATLNEKMATAEKARIAAEAELEAITALPAALLRKAFSGTL